MGRACSLRVLVLFFAAMALVFGAWPRRTAAQTATPRRGTQLRIRKISGVGRRGLVRTPRYEVDTMQLEKPTVPAEWARVAVEYDTAPEWMDELAFQYFVMTAETERGQKQFSLYRLTVRYVDIEEGTHTSTVFLRPAALKRFGEVVAVAVEISAGGEVLAEETDFEGIKMPERWWRNPAVVESKGVTVRDGYLLNRADSPWSRVNMDGYEVIR